MLSVLHIILKVGYMHARYYLVEEEILFQFIFNV